MTKKVIISLDIATDKTTEEVIASLKKGIYYGADVARVAAPKDVKINYCVER